MYSSLRFGNWPLPPRLRPLNRCLADRTISSGGRAIELLTCVEKRAVPGPANGFPDSLAGPFTYDFVSPLFTNIYRA
jgi:hypothetical protein